MKTKKQKSNIILYMAYFMILTAISLLVEIGNADDIIKYWGATGMHSGLKLYKDINIVVPPFSYLLAELSLYIWDSLIMIRILNAFVWWGVCIFVHKICSKYTINKYVVAFLNICIILYAFAVYGFYYDYNILSLLFALVIIYFILNKEFNYKNAILIALFCSLMIWTKHTIGGVFFLITAAAILIYHKKDKKFVKNIILMFLTGIAVSLCFFGYLIYNETLGDFIDLGIMGMGDFKSNFLLSIGIEVIFFFILMIAIVVNLIKKRKMDSETKVILLFALGCIAFLYPIVDYPHLIPLFFFALILFYKLISTKDGNINVLVAGTGLIAFIAVVFVCLQTWKGEKIQSEFSAYRYLLISPAYEQRINEMEEYISKVDGEVYIIDKYAMIYDTAMRRNQGYYDLLWNGNTGSKTSLEYVQLLEEKDCYVLINMNNAEAYQWDSKIHEYVKTNYQYVDKMGNWALYHVESKSQ